MTAFQKRVEDFECGHCGERVHGNGYTNHCPTCLWSKHVDISPGDRFSECRSLMKPLRVEGGMNRWIIVHECISCGYEKRNHVSDADDREILAHIAKESIKDRAGE